MRLWDEAERTYGRCLALPFYSYIDAGGTVWGCKEYLGDERFAFGNINEQTFREIWEGPRRAALAAVRRRGARRARLPHQLPPRQDEPLALGPLPPPAHANFI